MRIRTPWIFTLGAGIYDAITAQDVWRRHFRAMVARVPGPRVLDLGVGPGVSAIEMVRTAPAYALTGVDCSPVMLARARRHATAAGVRLSLVRADAARLPFPDASYDGATGHSLLYLLDDSDAALREVHRVVRPGGGVAFLEPSSVEAIARLRAVWRARRHGCRHSFAMLLWSTFSRLHGRYTPSTLAAQLARCGFRDPRVTPAFDGLGLVATAVRR
jgi:ubiquinone/menaquinone biosynthesis C-methylase UbiE